jgi:hypothetical protein
MRTLYRLLRADFTPKLLVGALVIFFLYHGVVGQQQPGPIAATPILPVAQAYLAVPQQKINLENRIIELARTDHISLLKLSLQNYESKIQDFTATFHKQERINDNLKDTEDIAIKFKEDPFSLVMDWQKNHGAVDKLLFVEGQNGNKMVVHPAGWLSWIKSVKRDPQDKQVKQSSRRTPDQFGFQRTIESLLDVYEKAKVNNDLKIAYLGQTEVFGRSCVSMERTLPPKPEYPYARLVMDFDTEYLLPVSISCYDWQGRLLSRYTYENLQFNVGLTAANFTPDANGL